MGFSGLHASVVEPRADPVARFSVRPGGHPLPRWVARLPFDRRSPRLPRALPRQLVERICPRLADPTRMAIRIRHIDELRAARARLVAAYDSEQRRVERALHDGVQQDLTGVSVRLQLLRRLLPGDAADAAELLDEIIDEVRAAADGLRRLAAEIHPSLLELWGLGPALRDATAAAGGRVTLETVGLGRYPPEIELAAYRLCLAARRRGRRHGHLDRDPHRRTRAGASGSRSTALGAPSRENPTNSPWRVIASRRSAESSRSRRGRAEFTSPRRCLSSPLRRDRG